MNSRHLTSGLLILATALSFNANAEEQLGRLFMTPQRRAVLEQQRKYNIEEQQTPQGATMSLDGVIVRSNGKKTVWINGRAQNDNKNGSGVSTNIVPGNPGQAGIESSDGARTRLRVGQKLNRATREISDELGGGKLEVKPPQSQH